MAKCHACPRACGADRAKGERGFCGCGDTVRIARAALHLWEEPVISGKRGSGTIFFSGCNLRCVFCQNYDVSHHAKGRDITREQLADCMLDLQRQGAHNINLVTPTQYADAVIEVLSAIRKQLYVPVVYNCGGYESLETIDRLAGLIDVYMPDFKFFSPEIAKNYAGAPDYFEVARAAIFRMQEQVGRPEIDEATGVLKKGVLVRHLVLPGCRKDSIEIIRQLRSIFEPDEILLSLMSQYTPDFAMDCPFENLHRRVTTLEYESVMHAVEEAGFDGFFQERSSATKKYTPPFFGDGEDAKGNI